MQHRTFIIVKQFIFETLHTVFTVNSEAQLTILMTYYQFVPFEKRKHIFIVLGCYLRFE